MTITHIKDLTPDPHNANKGTPRGHGIVNRSIRERGAGRSGLAARGGTMIAGSQTLEEMALLGIPIRPVHTDGTEWVVVIRDDIEDGSPDAQLLALEDNRGTETGLAWDAERLAALQAEDAALLAGLWRADELDSLLAADDWDAALGNLPTGDKAPFQQMTFTVSDAQAETINDAIHRAKTQAPFLATGNENSNGNALARICEAFGG